RVADSPEKRAATTGRTRIVGSVNVMDPVHVAGVGVPPVGDRAYTAAEQLAAPASRHQAKQRLAQPMPAERARRLGDEDVRETVQILARAMRDEMYVGGLFAREIPREVVVRDVHAAVRHEVTSDEEPRGHAATPFLATPWSAPARNQNCNPIWVTNGVKLKMS